MDFFNASDFVAFGLILHISNINEIEHFNDRENSWKTIQNGISIAFISFYSVLFACSLLGQSNPGLINVEAITHLSIVLSFVSFLISFSVYHTISKFREKDTFEIIVE
jgi:cytosine/uracil/thiamine/allantoin permease